VGLTEISFPSDIENVSDGHCYYTIHVQDRFFRKIMLDAKHYATIRDLVREMNAKWICLSSFSYQTAKSE